MDEYTLMAMIVIVGLAGLSFVGLNLYEDKRWLALMMLTCAIAVIICCYALLYHSIGVYCVKDYTQHPNALQCLYFSVVTWTTLGYGDFHPGEGLSQYLAASEAIMGYVYMGLLVASIATPRRST